MYTIQDFENFEVCAVIQKTSESGITSNQRLLVIKSGILYYHSKVPSGFNSNSAEQLKSLNSLNNIPKCSIFTPYLKTIKVDSKSPLELTITFLAKDLKGKQELAKRASTIEPYELFQKDKTNSKADNKTIQWKVKFTSTQKCKQWSKYLQQLKQHYKKLEQEQNEMYEKFLQNFNEDKKKVNQQRRSLAVSSVKSPVSPSNRATHFPSDGLGTSALAGIIQVEDDRVSQTSSSKLNDSKRKNAKKQAIADYLKSTLFDGDKDKQRVEQKEDKSKIAQFSLKSSSQTDKNKQKQKQQSIKSKEREDKMKQINLLEKQMKNRNTNNKTQNEYSYFYEPKQQKKTQKQLQQERLREQEEQKQRKKQRQEEEQKQRLRSIQFARKRERERAERQRRQEEEEQRNRKQREERQQRERKQEQQRQKRQQGQQKQEAIKYVPPVEQQQSQPVFQVTENMLDSQTQKSLEMKNSRKNNHGNSLPVIAREQVISFNPIKSIQLPFNFTQTPYKISAKQKIKSQRKKSNVQDSQLIDFLSYVDYQEELFNQKFQQRIKKQTEFLKYVVKLREEAKEIFEKIVNSFNTPIETKQFKIINKTYVSDRVTIDFAFCQTKTIALYEGERTLYDQSSFKILKEKFSIYNLVQSNILQSLKKKQKVSLRVPFYVLLQYRGVMGLVMLNDFLLDSQTISLEEASSQLSSQASLIIPTHLTHHFKFARVFSTNKYIVIVDTLFVQQNTQNQKHVLNLSKTIDMQRKQRLPSFEKTKQLLQKRNQLQIQEIQNLELLLYTYHVRSLYRSGQGQLEEKDFFSLILSLNPQYSKLLGSSCPSKYPLKGLFCQYINQLCGVSIELSQLLGKQQLLAGNIQDVSYHSICRIYSFPCIEVFSLIDGFQEFQDKQISKDILKFWKIYSLKNEYLDQIYVIYKITYLIKSNKMSEALQQIETLLDSLRYTHPFKLKCYQFLLNHYHSIHDLAKFSSYFYDALNYVQFTFGNHSIFLITLYCILGQFLSQHGQSQQAHNFYNKVISKTSNARILTEMEIDRSNIYLNMTNKQTITQILTFTLSLLNKRDGMARMKLIKFLAYLYNLAGKQAQSVNYIQQAIEYFQTNNSKIQLIQCYMLGSNIWHNNLTKLKQIILKVYQIIKIDDSYLNKLCELIKVYMMRLSARANIEISYLKSKVPKREQFETIKQKINGSIVQYIHQIFSKIQENQVSEEISEFLQFVFN